MQVATMGILFFVNDRNNDRRAKREEMMIERCFPAKQMRELREITGAIKKTNEAVGTTEGR
jgi:hypothetical protein